MSRRAQGRSVDSVSPIVELNLATDAESPVLTADELTIFFSSSRGTVGGFDVWTAHRATVSVAFEAPEPVVELSTSRDDYPTWVSEDGCDVILETFGSGKATRFYASRPR